MAGTANSLMGSVRFGVGAVMGSLVASFKMETAAPMLYTMTACVMISVLSYYFLTIEMNDKVRSILSQFKNKGGIIPPFAKSINIYFQIRCSNTRF